MMRFLDPYAECTHDTLRIVAGYTFLLHGVQTGISILVAESGPLYTNTPLRTPDLFIARCSGSQLKPRSTWNRL